MRSAKELSFLMLFFCLASTAFAQYIPLGSAEEDLKTYTKAEVREFLLDVGGDPEIGETLMAGRRYKLGANIFYVISGIYAIVSTVSLFSYVYDRENNRFALIGLGYGAFTSLASFSQGSWMNYMSKKRYQEALQLYYGSQP